MTSADRVGVVAAVVAAGAVAVVTFAPAASAAADRAVAAVGAPAFPYDWLFHLAAWTAVAFTAAWAARRRLWVTVSVLAVVAVVAEVAQAAVPGRTVEPADLAANLAGVAVGVAAALRRARQELPA